MTVDIESGAPAAPKVRFADIPMAASRAAGWEALRQRGRVVLAEDDFYYLTREDDVLAALRNPHVYSSKEAFDNLGSPIPLVPIGIDPPEHTRYRKILQPFFSPGTLGAMLPSLQSQAAEMIDQVAAKGSCDAVAAIAVPYPSQVFLTFFGLPLTERDRLIAWKDSVISLAESPSLDGIDITPALELFTFLTDTINARRADPADDVLSQLLTREDALNDQDAIGLSFLFVLAGLDTVTAAIGFALHELARNPELRRSIAGDPKKIRDFVEEIVRLESPVPAVPRVTTAEVTIGDVTLPAGTAVRLCLGAINREESGDELLLDGVPHRHWGYGGGPHRCLGSHLARMELSLVIEEWLVRIPEFEVTPGSDPHINYPAGTHQLRELRLTYPPVSGAER